MPLIIPVFIPHQGCPHCCIFCNQFQISGRADKEFVSPEKVQGIIGEWLQRSAKEKRDDVEVAFYGGSFTGLPVARQEELLGAVAPYLRSGAVRTIRLSTRPDYIDRKKIDLLKEKGVGVVELGVQSMDDRVLQASNRGHGAGQSAEAVVLLREAGFQVGVQVMIGLPKQTTLSLLQTARMITELEPSFVRIYPVCVLRGSRLADLYEQGRYRPLSIGEAVVRAARIKKIFDEYGIKVIRIGLQSGLELEKSLIAGPYHPAFGEMVASRLMFQQTRKILARGEHGNRVILQINDKDQSIFRGIQSANMNRLAELGLADRFTLQPLSTVPRHCIHVAPDLNPY